MDRRNADERSDSQHTSNDEPGRYEVRVRGHLDARWSAWFDGLTLTKFADGTTLIEGSVADQAALHGVLQRIRDLGLELVSVIRL